MVEINTKEIKLQWLQTLIGFKNIDEKLLEESKAADFRSKFMQNMLKKTVQLDKSTNQISTEEDEGWRTSVKKWKWWFVKFLLVNPNSIYFKIIDYFYMILIIYSCFTVMFRSAFEDYTDLWIIIIDFIIEGIFFVEALSKYAVYPFIWILNRVDTFKSAILSLLLQVWVWFDIIPLVFTVV